MLLTQTLDKLDALGLFGMALGLREQLEGSQYTSLSFEERFGLLVDREAEARDSRRLALRLKAAKLRQEATMEDLDFRAPRGLDRSIVLSLAQAGWVAAKHNLLVTGPTGAGKSFLACALAHAAIRRCTCARHACWRNWHSAVVTGGTCVGWRNWPGSVCSSWMTSC